MRETPVLAAAFEKVVLAISDQMYGLQGRSGATLEQLSEGTGVSDRGLMDIFKTASDPKISTLVRIAHFHGCELTVSFRPRVAGSAVR